MDSVDDVRASQRLYRIAGLASQIAVDDGQKMDFESLTCAIDAASEINQTAFVEALRADDGAELLRVVKKMMFEWCEPDAIRRATNKINGS